MSAALDTLVFDVFVRQRTHLILQKGVSKLVFVRPGYFDRWDGLHLLCGKSGIAIFIDSATAAARRLLRALQRDDVLAIWRLAS